jgi:acyl transferase domain-containing protein
MPPALQDDIAIVGMACRFAGAADPSAFWRNLVAGKSAIGDHPNPLAPRVLDTASPRFERLCTQRGGYLRELNAFQPADFGLPSEAAKGVNPDQFLTLQLASEALGHAGIDPRNVSALRTGLVLGYASPLNAATANWLQHGLVVDQTAALLQRLFPGAAETQISEIRQAMKSTLPPIHAAGVRSAFGHALAASCATTLGVTGSAVAIDAGSASALQALRMAMDELRLGRCDVVLAGAVQNCTSLQVLMGLACLCTFTTRDIPCPLSRDADGTLPGEGGGFLVLQRRREAEKEGRTVYALLKGIGLAAGDGPAGSVPALPQGLVAAMQAAQDEAGVDPASIGMVEAHGSAVPREDLLEIQALRQVFYDRTQPVPRILVGSIKSQIGHCFAAAGLAGVVKAALALHHRVLPPMILCPGRIHPRLVQAPSPFYVDANPRPWVQGRRHPPRRAAVNALDAAGLHAHAVLEEFPVHR